jgi:putative CRISPR-associated protein (TIGR02620 family)
MHAFIEVPDVIVTRHRGLVTHLVERGIVALSTAVIEHATARDVSGKWVVGVLPLHLAALCDRVTEIPLALTAEMRGRELSATEVAAIAGEPRTYCVREVRP